MEIESLRFQALIRKGLLCDGLDSRLRGNDDVGRSYLNRLYKSDFQTASRLFRIIRKRIRPKDWYERQQIKHEHGGGQNRGDGDEEYRVHVH